MIYFHSNAFTVRSKFVLRICALKPTKYTETITNFDIFLPLNLAFFHFYSISCFFSATTRNSGDKLSVDVDDSASSLDGISNIFLSISLFSA